jgi:hypothetical protein
MEFLIWHLLAIGTVMAVSFVLGYITGKSIRRKENGNITRW